MKAHWLAAVLVLLCLPPVLPADEADKGLKTYQVPYRLTNTLHMLVRAKINGKGPLNFLLDTGAPLVYVSKEAGKKIGLTADKDGWITPERFELEGGPVQEKLKCRLETPFQIEGMNAIGFAGVELHGIIGCSLLARYRLQMDFTRDTMTWTRLNFEPPAPVPLGAGKGAAPAGLSALGGMMKLLSEVVGKQPQPQLVPRGFLGIQLGQDEKSVVIEKVLPESPAARAGLKAEDQLRTIQGEEVKTVLDVYRLTARITTGTAVNIRVRRGNKEVVVRVTAGEGL